MMIGMLMATAAVKRRVREAREEEVGEGRGRAVV